MKKLFVGLLLATFSTILSAQERPSPELILKQSIPSGKPIEKTDSMVRFLHRLFHNTKAKNEFYASVTGIAPKANWKHNYEFQQGNRDTFAFVYQVWLNVQPNEPVATILYYRKGVRLTDEWLDPRKGIRRERRDDPAEFYKQVDVFIDMLASGTDVPSVLLTRISYNVAESTYLEHFRTRLKHTGFSPELTDRYLIIHAEYVTISMHLNKNAVYEYKAQYE